MSAAHQGHQVVPCQCGDDDKPAVDISKDIEDQLRAAGATIGTVDDELF